MALPRHGGLHRARFRKVESILLGSRWIQRLATWATAHPRPVCLVHTHIILHCLLVSATRRVRMGRRPGKLHSVLADAFLSRKLRELAFVAASIRGEKVFLINSVIRTLAGVWGFVYVWTLEWHSCGDYNKTIPFSDWGLLCFTETINQSLFL